MITDEDYKKYPYHTDGAILGIKIVKSLTDKQLISLKGQTNGKKFETLRLSVGRDTNPSWVAARITNELYDRKLIYEREYDYLNELFS